MCFGSSTGMAALIVTAFLAFLYFIYNYVSTAHSYWKRKGVNGPQPHPFYGTFKTALGTQEDSIPMYCYKVSKQFPDEKVVGLYQALTPTLLVVDPELIKKVLIQDFHYFKNRGIRVGNDPISKTLFAADSDDWKPLRRKLSPIFTTGKLRGMMPLLNSCADQFVEYLNTSVVARNGPKELRDLMKKYSMKTITSVAFGLEVNTFAEKPTEFEIMATRLLQNDLFRRCVVLLSNFSPQLGNLLHLSTMAPPVVDFFLKLVREMIKEREGKPKVRKDFMDLIIELREQESITVKEDDEEAKLKITDELITAQAIVFYAGGFHTSSGAMSFLMYELAKQPALQERCAQEIRKVMEQNNGQLDYDSLNDLAYTSMALEEALRMYPIAALLVRQCVQDYTFKDINLKIDEGIKLMIPLLSMHRNPKYFPNPEKFDPDRFSPENRQKIHDYYKPFGDGPRNCIGLRFARVQSLLGIAHFLYHFQVSTCEKTAENISFDPRLLSLTAKDGVWLNIDRRMY